MSSKILWGDYGFRFLATICNSMIIEIYNDMFWISQIIQPLKRLKYIAAIWNLALWPAIKDILNFFVADNSRFVGGINRFAHTDRRRRRCRSVSRAQTIFSFCREQKKPPMTACGRLLLRQPRLAQVVRSQPPPSPFSIGYPASFQAGVPPWK
jgi:hypothetical protein